MNGNLTDMRALVRYIKQHRETDPKTLFEGYKGKSGRWDSSKTLLNTITLQSFQRKVIFIRKEHNLHAGGSSKPVVRKFNGSYTVQPEEWLKYRSDIGSHMYDMTKSIWKLSEDYHLPILQLQSVLLCYILFNVLLPPEFADCLEVCIVSNEKELARRIPGNRFERNVANTFYPISIRISPYAEKTKVVQFVEDYFNDKIKPLQKKYIHEGIASIQRMHLAEKRKEQLDIYRKVEVEKQALARVANEKGINQSEAADKFGKERKIQQKK